MKTTPLFFGLALCLILLSGCTGDAVVHQKSVMILNQKAQELLNAGQPVKAAGRLESALDLIPNEPSTMNNLASAYYAGDAFEDAAQAYENLVKVLEGSTKETKGLSLGSVQQSLGTCYESLGDKRSADADEIKDLPKPNAEQKAKADKATTEAIAAYEKAIAAYEAIKPKRNDLEQQVNGLKQRIEELKTPN